MIRTSVTDKGRIPLEERGALELSTDQIHNARVQVAAIRLGVIVEFLDIVMPPVRASLGLTGWLVRVGDICLLWGSRVFMELLREYFPDDII